MQQKSRVKYDYLCPLKKVMYVLMACFLNYAAYFKTNVEGLKTIVDFIISQQPFDGGFNCRYNQKGVKHSSLHSTISVIEGIHEYFVNGYAYRLNELLTMEEASQELILKHRLLSISRA